MVQKCHLRPEKTMTDFAEADMPPKMLIYAPKKWALSSGGMFQQKTDAL